jgi:ABC-type multidrug transport system ATPase subunit
MIQVQSLTISYNGTNLVENISFSVPKNSVFTFIGESGKGKSSLFSCLMGFSSPKTGKINIDGEQLNPQTVRSIRSKIAWLPQNLNSLPNLQLKDQVSFLKSFKKNNHLFHLNEFSELAEEFRLKDDILNSNFSELSGGEKQRIALIYCILQRKSILFLDEPTSALDELSERAIINYLKNQREITIVASSHSDIWISESDNILRV